MIDSHARLGEAFVSNPPLGDYARMHTRLRLSSSAGGRISLCDGRNIEADGDFGDLDDIKLIYLPSFQSADPDRPEKEVQYAERFHLWLRRQSEAGVMIGACGTSVLHLAVAGLLDDREAAIHPRLIAPFQCLFPAVKIDAVHAVNVSGNVMTCGPDTDNAALVVRMFAEAFSIGIARGLALREPSGTASDLLGAAIDPLVAQAQMWIRDRFARDFRIIDLAAKLGVSHQALIRHFRAAGAGTPRAFVQRIRIESAASMLLETNRTVTEIAQLVGYADIPSFRRIFLTMMGISPSAYRRQGR
jgi:transcriptional regulator GlxA family with amidase domain